MMESKEVLKRKIELKGQALKLIRAERDLLLAKLTLLRLKDDLEMQIGKPGDPLLSRKLDCVTFLLEN